MVLGGLDTFDQGVVGRCHSSLKFTHYNGAISQFIWFWRGLDLVYFDFVFCDRVEILTNDFVASDT